MKYPKKIGLEHGFSLSADTRSMLHDEMWKAIKAQEKRITEWSNIVGYLRADARETELKVCELIERVQALEHALSKLHDIDNEPIFPEPLPQEDLD